MGEIADRLGIRDFSRTDFITLLDFVLETAPVRTLFLSHAKPAPPPHECVELYPKYVFDIPLSGAKHLIYGNGQDLRERHLQSGEALVHSAGNVETASLGFTA